MNGKQYRLKRIFNQKTNKTILLPMDHGMTMGPISGIEDVNDTLEVIAKSKVNAVLLQKGLVNNCNVQKLNNNQAVVMHLSANTMLNPNAGYKAIIATVEDALVGGCDAVSVHLNIGDDFETNMLKEIGRVSSACERYGMPLIAMVYARGNLIKDEYAVDKVMHAARVGAEIGADIVKVNYTGSIDTFSEVVKGCPIPVVIAGGSKTDSEEDILRMVNDAIIAGAAGISIGRNIFQSKNMLSLLDRIDNIVTKNACGANLNCSKIA